MAFVGRWRMTNYPLILFLKFFSEKSLVRNQLGISRLSTLKFIFHLSRGGRMGGGRGRGKGEGGRRGGGRWRRMREGRKGKESSLFSGIASSRSSLYLYESSIDHSVTAN